MVLIPALPEEAPVELILTLLPDAVLVPLECTLLPAFVPLTLCVAVAIVEETTRKAISLLIELLPVASSLSAV